MLKLTVRQQNALREIGDTFAPRQDGWPSASDCGVPEALANALEFNPRVSDRAEFLQLLDFWDSWLHSFFAIGNFSHFHSLPPELKIRVLQDWAGSSLAKRRGAFQALRKAVGFFYVMLPGASGAASPAWERMGYPGPLGVQKPNQQRLLKVSVPERDEDVSCEVCVIGSGAGGATAAGMLAEAGKDVVILESGGYYDDADFDGSELNGFQRLYAEAGFAATADHSVGLLAGECVGGGTVVNYCTSFRTPDDVRAEWAAGLPWITGKEYCTSMDAVCARLSVNLEHNKISAREQVLERGLQILGWHADRMPRNVVGCDQGKVCGACGYGCALGAKQSAAKTWLVDAQAFGARIIAETRAQRIRIEAGRATGVGAVSEKGHRVRVKCKAVVAACGSIHTPALLLRSGLRNSHIGQHLHLHPVSNVGGVFAEEIRPWEGTMQAVYSDQHRFMDGNYGVKYETTALQPVIAVAAFPWQDPVQFRSLLGKLSKISAIGVLVRDRDGGTVTIDKQGHPVARYSLSDFDRKHLREGFLGAARILEAAGAQLIFSPHAKYCNYQPGRRGSIDTFAADMDSAGWGNGQVALFSFHIMGTAKLGSSARNSAANPEGETWETKGLYVMDAAAFPGSSGVNPMITIEAMAHRNAGVLAAKL